MRIELRLRLHQYWDLVVVIKPISYLSCMSIILTILSYIHSISDILEVVNVNADIIKLYSLDRSEEVLMIAVISKQNQNNVDKKGERMTIMRLSSNNERQLLYNALR